MKVTKKQVGKASAKAAAAAAIATAAANVANKERDKYIKLKKEFEDGK